VTTDGSRILFPWENGAESNHLIFDRSGNIIARDRGSHVVIDETGQFVALNKTIMMALNVGSETVGTDVVIHDLDSDHDTPLEQDASKTICHDKDNGGGDTVVIYY